MRIRKFYVDNMREGMDRIKNELGSDAVIVQSRKVKKKGLLGFFSSPQIEITAAVESPNIPSNGQPRNNFFEEKIQQELSDLRGLVNRVLTRDNMPSEEISRERKELTNWRARLETQEVAPELITKYLDEIKQHLSGEIQLTEEIVGLMLRKKLRKSLMVSHEKTAPLQVFVGPTGVGKTTTLAKLAARYSLYHGEKVGIITIDHYRIGAIEQLRTYADITGLPLEVVMSPKDLRTALGKMSGYQRVLIDTAGRGTLNTRHINELANYLQYIPEAEIFLVVSATTKARDLRLIVNNFKQMKYNKLIFTKLDETQSYGNLLNCSYITGLPLVYLTNGQSVPDDLELADAEKVTDLILGADA